MGTGIKYLLIVFIIVGSSFLLQGCQENIFKDLKEKDYDIAASTLIIKKVSLVTDANKITDFPADGTSLLKIEISLNPTTNVEANRKVTLTTTAGDFIVGNESKKVIEVTLNENGTYNAYLRAPNAAASGVITAATVNGIAIAQTNLTFVAVATPTLTIDTISLLTNSSTTSGFLADGTSLLKIPITLTPTTTAIENRKVTLTTTVGDFIVGSESKKVLDITVNSNGSGEVYLKSPNTAASGVISASTVNNTVNAATSIAFESATPTEVMVETPQSMLKDSSATPITVRLSRTIGRVSDGQRGNFQLLLGGQPVAERVSFIESTASQNGIITAKLVLEKIPVGKYELRVTVGGISGKKDIEVKK